MVVTWIWLAAVTVSAYGAVVPEEFYSILKPERYTERFTCGRVWITIHSPELRESISSTILDAIELNWDYSGCANTRRVIGLFNIRPAANSMSNALVAWTIPTQTGRIITNIPLGNGILPAGWNSGQGQRGAHCLWPWVGAGENQIAIINCLKIQPTWMQDSAAQINHLRIGELALPGTHNAGAWQFNTEVSNAARDLFILCQDRSIWEQLVHGIRYLDFRVGYYGTYANEDNRYWLNHNMVRIRPLVPLLREIRQFLDATQEVVFLDFHHFPVGFYDNNSPIRSIHNGLLRIVERELGPHIARAHDFPWVTGTRGPLLANFVNANKRLVLAYIDNTIVNENNWLFRRLPHLWANTNDVTTLFDFLDNNLALAVPRPNEINPMHAAMAQTTPTALDIALLRTSIRRNADAVNHMVTMRLINRWRQNANIIASDFFLGNDVIDQSILISQERGQRQFNEIGTEID